MNFSKSIALYVSLIPAMALSQSAFAQGLSLRVAPVSIEAEAPVVSGTLKMSNGGNRPMRVQARIFKWVQRNGKDMYIPTKEVVVSPPLITLRPKTDSVLRVVRVSKKPISGQETYRVVIDQLPDNTVGKQSAQAVSFVMRHNVPAFFSGKGDFSPNLKWSVKSSGKFYQLTAVNNGNSYMRLSQVKLLAAGKVVGVGKGLVGYILPGATMRFNIPSTGAGKPTRIEARGVNNVAINDVVN